MTERWTDRLKTRRAAVADRADELSTSARQAAQGASERIGSVYGQVRSRVSDSVGPTRDRAERLIEAGTAQAGKLAKGSRDQIDRAAFASRGLIAERPLTAVAIGIGAGLVFGLLANRLGRSQPDATETDEIEDDWLQ
jgi:ElaB/YqjD/DUF883 family membrane-anchored ribosome-binding protein